MNLIKRKILAGEPVAVPSSQMSEDIKSESLVAKFDQPLNPDEHSLDVVDVSSTAIPPTRASSDEVTIKTNGDTPDSRLSISHGIQETDLDVPIVSEKLTVGNGVSATEFRKIFRRGPETTHSSQPEFPSPEQLAGLEECDPNCLLSEQPERNTVRVPNAIGSSEDDVGGHPQSPHIEQPKFTHDVEPGQDLIDSKILSQEILTTHGDFRSDSIGRNIDHRVNALKELLTPSKFTESQRSAGLVFIANDVVPKERIREILSSILALDIANIVGVDDKDFAFGIITKAGQDILFKAEELYSQAKFGRIIFKQTHVFIPKFGSNEWRQIAQLIVANAEKADQDIELSIEGVLKSSLSNYFNEFGKQTSTDEATRVRFAKESPFEKEGYECLFLSHFQSWLSKSSFGQITSLKLARLLEKCGWERITIRVPGHKDPRSVYQKRLPPRGDFNIE